jgi:hypothetical protein
MEVEEKVLVSKISAPTSRTASWMSRMMPGWVIESRSLLPLISPGWSAKRPPRYSSSERP